MKKLALSIIVLFSVALVNAQNDTTFYYKEHQVVITDENGEIKVKVSNSQLDSSEVLLFEGTYGEEYSSEVSVNFSFQKMIPNKKKKKRLYPHSGGLSIGFSNLATRDLNIGNMPDAQLKYNSYELGFQIGTLNAPIATQYGWLFFSGIGLRYHQYNADFNTAFKVVDNYTRQVPGEDVKYKRSKIGTWYVTVPFMFEWQKKIGKRSFYCQFGAEAGILFYSKSKVKYFNEEGKKVKETYGRGLNINPLTVDARVGIGIGDFGLYARYGLVHLFRQDRGARVIPVAAGFVFNF
ncbi:outer membrane beta-barrel protein [Bacteroidales bacterium OttesenSCG-928-B11]|nr:outer membrane beta-barrel protein [Bacteroidales bacterium OttesenSCG-928-E04]MDL2309185.1 outer membrane beta-barrel protein [Bacteroidales bacterium OttesenSCG-928-C03]MDL2312061.1 outer membrane beta-barrel protein [Bacteroidales bacterium OttesenSCG-928-B11]MDL2325671.1 outer membrane beta-barrel protein [Bacteroidales bacterium OttesenSCG-928-A14]